MFEYINYSIWFIQESQPEYEGRDIGPGGQNR